MTMSSQAQAHAKAYDLKQPRCLFSLFSYEDKHFAWHLFAEEVAHRKVSASKIWLKEDVAQRRVGSEKR